MPTSSSCTLSRRSTTRRPRLKTRPGEREHHRRLRRARRPQHEPSAPRQPATQGAGLRQHRRQLDGPRLNCRAATPPRALLRRHLRESRRRRQARRSLSSELPHRLQTPASSQTSLLHHRTEHEHNQELLLGRPRRLCHRRPQFPQKISPWEASSVCRLRSLATEYLQVHHHRLQVEGQFHLRLRRATRRQRLHHCRRRRQARRSLHRRHQ